jgi:hypothetical protein
VAAHRYWRVRSPDTWISGEYMACTELALASAFGGANLAAGKTATASADAGSTYAAGKAVDGNAGTFWTTGASAAPVGGHWLAVDLGAGNDADIAEVKYTVRPDSYREDPVRLILEWSDDGATWTVLWDLNGIAAWSAGETRTFRWDGSTAYQVAGERVHQQYAYLVTNGSIALQVAQQYAYLVTNTPVGPDPSPSATARYWRLLITEDQRISGGGNYYCNVAEFDLLGGYGSEVTYSSSSSTGNFSGATYDSSKAFDNNNSTCWSGDMNINPAVTPRWLRADLGSAKEIHGASITGFDTSGPKSFKVQYSLDDVTWTDFLQVTGQTGWSAGLTRTYDPTTYPPIVATARRKRTAQIIG